MLAVDEDGALYAWGANNFGSHGNGTLTSTKAPVRIGEANDWKTIRAGNGHTVALKKDGSMYAWGLNEEGQLGVGKWWYTTPIYIGQ